MPAVAGPEIERLIQLLARTAPMVIDLEPNSITLLGTHTLEHERVKRGVLGPNALPPAARRLAHATHARQEEAVFGYRQPRRHVAPVFEAAFVFVDGGVQRLSGIRPEASKGHQQVVARQDVDRVHLDGAELVEQIDWLADRWIAEVLGTQSQGARFLRG